MRSRFDAIGVASSRDGLQSLPVWVHLAGIFSDLAAGALVIHRAHGGLERHHPEVLRPPTTPRRPVTAPKP